MYKQQRSKDKLKLYLICLKISVNSFYSGAYSSRAWRQGKNWLISWDLEKLGQVMESMTWTQAEIKCPAFDLEVEKHCHSFNV